MRHQRWSLGLAALVTALSLGWAWGQTVPPAPPAPPATAPAGPAIVRSAAHASNQFMVDLYKKLSAEKGNVFFSPYSVASALTLAERGARRNTAGEMATVLHLPPDSAELGRAYASLVADLQADVGTKGYQLTVANAIWPQQGEPVQKAFLDDALRNFQGTAQPLDFISAPDASRTTINDWVAKKTNDKIKDLLPAGSVNAYTRMIIANAVYFKGNWAAKFDRAGTERDAFHVTPDKSVQAELMHQKKHYNYTTDGRCQALELLYKGGDVGMVILLPVKTDHDASKLEAALTLPYVSEVLGRLADQEVELTMPKWKLNCFYDLSPTLQQMGMKEAFTQEADFSGINGRKDLYIGMVAHKTFIEVNEESTEAAAATGVEMMTLGVHVGAPQPIRFVADRPFIYFIYHRVKKTVLFMGRMYDPTAG